MCEAIRWEQADGWKDVSSLKCVCVCAATLVVCSSPKAKIMDVIHYLRKSRGFKPPDRWGKLLDKAVRALDIEAHKG